MMVSDGSPTPTIFQPFAQEEIFSGALVIRTKSDPALLQPTALRAIRELYPRQLIENVATLEQVRDATVAPRRLNALFIASFGGLAMVIAMVGIAGVLAFSVSSRDVGDRNSHEPRRRRVARAPHGSRRGRCVARDRTGGRIDRRVDSRRDCCAVSSSV
jgi:hypothetical protein